MRSSLTASTLLPAVFWSMFLLFVFATPMLMAARDGGGDTEVQATDGRTAELIRQHREAVSPHALGGNLRNGPAITEETIEDWSFVRESQTEPVIRPVGNRAKRIRV